MTPPHTKAQKLPSFHLLRAHPASDPSAASHGHAKRTHRPRRVPVVGCALVSTRVTALRVDITSAATLTTSAQGEGSTKRQHQWSDFCLLLRSPRLALRA